MARDATEVEFVKLSSTGNMTLLVASRHPVRQYRAIASQLLSTGHVHAEQVGFIRTPTSAEAQVRLHMAGDEFCGNACMAIAAMTAAEQGLATGDRADIVLEASGADTFVTCRVERHDPGYGCEMAMPAPSRVEPHPFPGARPGSAALVHYPDALHLVVECAPHDQMMRDRAQDVAARLGATEGVSVVGVMLYDPARRHLAPLINVPALDSMVWERSCGSGTGSVGAYLATKSGGPVRSDVHHPGGTMHVSADHGPDGVSRLVVGGQVRIVASGTGYVHA